LEPGYLLPFSKETATLPYLYSDQSNPCASVSPANFHFTDCSTFAIYHPGLAEVPSGLSLNPVHATPSYFYEIHFNIVKYYM
jgi:hypothetical protein